jgi:hypothetical protein
VPRLTEAQQTFIDAGVTISEGLRLLGFEVGGKTDEGIQLSHCGQSPTIGHGLWGDDVVECKACGAELVKFTSTHVNGGLILEEWLLDLIGERCWHVRSLGRLANG